MSSAFDRLRQFLTEQMRMSHIYQPLMLKTLVERGGWASTRDIAAAFLSRGESQIEYYSEITKRMPGQVLAPRRHTGTFFEVFEPERRVLNRHPL